MAKLTPMGWGGLGLGGELDTNTEDVHQDHCREAFKHDGALLPNEGGEANNSASSDMAAP